MAKQAHQANLKIGRFMVAAGVVVEHADSGKILVIKRAQLNDYRDGEWELVYGRIDQGESLEVGLARELSEETGIKKFEIVDQISTWHIYRGEKSPANEVIGVTFWVQVDSQQVKLSTEHDKYQWLDVEEAKKLIAQPGIREDVDLFASARENMVEANMAVETAQRALADYKNLIRRTQEERAKVARLSTLELMESLLLPLEHLSLASQQIKDPGIEMVVTEFKQALSVHGLAEIEAMGKSFDVNAMEVVERQGKGEKVIKVVKPGYRLNGEVIQHAKVVVA